MAEEGGRMMYLSPDELGLIHSFRKLTSNERSMERDEHLSVIFPINAGMVLLSVFYEKDGSLEGKSFTPIDEKEAELESILNIFNDAKADRLEAERLEAENRERLVLIVNELPESFVKRRILHILAPGSVPQLSLVLD